MKILLLLLVFALFTACAAPRASHSVSERATTGSELSYDPTKQDWVSTL